MHTRALIATARCALALAQRAYDAGRYDEAADAMLKSKWATQTPNRAGRLAQQMRTGEWQFGG